MCAVCCQLSNLITMSFGPVLPVSQAGYILSFSQQILGVILNVFIFTVVVAKFQKPHPDLVYSSNAVIYKRDGCPALVIRIGCAACHPKP